MDRLSNINGDRLKLIEDTDCKTNLPCDELVFLSLTTGRTKQPVTPESIILLQFFRSELHFISGFEYLPELAVDCMFVKMVSGLSVICDRFYVRSSI